MLFKSQIQKMNKNPWKNTSENYKDLVLIL